MSEPIRVLNLFTIMDRGGAETMVMNYYRNIDREKIQFDFMVHRKERGAYDDEIESLGGRIYRMPAIRPWTAKSYRKVVRSFYQQHPEYKIIHSHMSELGYYDFMEAEKLGIPVRICHAHNHPRGFDIKTPVRRYYATKMMSHLTHMFMCGEESGEWLFGKRCKDSFIQLNNAIDAQDYIFNEKLRNQVRSSLGISENQTVIGHVGRFNGQKNHKKLIDIFFEIHQLEPNAILLLVGDDRCELGDAIHQRVKRKGLDNYVRFLGVRSDVPELLQAMDVFLFPSLFEGLSVVSIEVQAAGLPMLISDKIPIECKKTDLVEVISLIASASEWARATLSAAKKKRRNTFEEIKAVGFDIHENVKWLQEFYIKVANGEK